MTKAPPIPQTIFLSESELWKLKQIARLRNDPKLDCVRTRKVDPSQSDFEIHYRGLQAEYAVAKYFKVPFDLSIDLGGDGGVFDLFIGDLRTQVKYSKTGDLLFNSLLNFTADIAVLVCPESEGVLKIVGYAPRVYFHNHYEQRNYGYGVRCILQGRNLLSISELKRYEPGAASNAS